LKLAGIAKKIALANGQVPDKLVPLCFSSFTRLFKQLDILFPRTRTAARKPATQQLQGFAFLILWQNKPRVPAHQLDKTPHDFLLLIPLKHEKPPNAAPEEHPRKELCPVHCFMISSLDIRNAD
jgi:hypothetical protein